MTTPTSALDQLGAALDAFITGQFQQPDGSPAALAFLPGAVAVHPESFYQSGVVNPALVANWLAAVADRVAPVLAAQISAIGLSASDVMTSVAQAATPTAPIGSPAANSFAQLKSEAAQALGPVGSPKTIRTAPLDWYDPDQVDNWPQYQHSVGGGDQADGGQADSNQASTGQDSGDQGTAAGSSLWSWRNAETLAPALSAAEATSGDGAPGGDSGDGSGGDSGGSSGGATGQPVGASSLTLTMNYQQVTLSRSTWWNDVLLSNPLWYFPGERAGALLPDGRPAGTPFGLPVAMVLTANVQISGQWSPGDMTAASTSTHLGPWHMSAQPFGTADASGGNATLSIPDMQLIAFVCEILPILPPATDPALPAPPPQYQPFPGADFFTAGRRSPIVAAMHNRLVAVGCDRYRSTGDEDVWGSGDVASYQAWQVKLGFQGSDADGTPGQSSWDRLQVPQVA
ncbi:peptidoglycan-binding protein [Kitasatospora sp. NPDC094028]